MGQDWSNKTEPAKKTENKMSTKKPAWQEIFSLKEVKKTKKTKTKNPYLYEIYNKL